MMDKTTRENVLRIIREAGDYAHRYWPGASDPLPFTVTTKSDDSPVTTVDVAVNDMLVGELSQEFPEAGFYTEEAAPSENLNEAKDVWVIDPIDGTAYFIEGEKDYAIFVALVRNEEAVFGATYFPAYESILWADTGAGSYLNERSLAVSKNRELLPGRVYVRRGEIADQRYLYPEEIGTAHGLYKLCTGEVDGLVVQITQHNEWDIAPWIPIVEESGGKITDGDGDPIRFHFGKLPYDKIIASNGEIHDQLMAIVKE